MRRNRLSAHFTQPGIGGSARIVLAAAEGLNSKEIASKVGVRAATVGAWSNRFAERGMDGLYDEPRRIGDEEFR